MERLLLNKVAFVTGGAQGIGAAVAEKFAAHGAKLMLADIQPADAAIARLLAIGSPAVEARICDISNEQAITDLMAATVETLGGIDIVVNVAGVISYRSIADLTAADWMKSFAINMVGAALITTQAFRHMKPGGTIVNISSVHAHRTAARVAPYAAAKAALVSFTRSAAIEGKALGIRSNAILPGAIDTAMLRSSENLATGEEVFDPAEVGQPGDVADAALYLASSMSRFVSGASLVVDGGLMTRL